MCSFYQYFLQQDYMYMLGSPHMFTVFYCRIHCRNVQQCQEKLSKLLNKQSFMYRDLLVVFTFNE